MRPIMFFKTTHSVQRWWFAFCCYCCLMGYVVTAAVDRLSEVAQISVSPLTRRLFSSKSKCVDGSRAVYYRDNDKIGQIAGSDHYIVWFPDGGICWDEPSCLRRNQQLPWYAGTGDAPASINDLPVFESVSEWRSAHHLYMYYCTSDAWLGSRGRRIVEELWTILRNEWIRIFDTGSHRVRITWIGSGTGGLATLHYWPIWQKRIEADEILMSRFADLHSSTRVVVDGAWQTGLHGTMSTQTGSRLQSFVKWHQVDTTPSSGLNAINCFGLWPGCRSLAQAAASIPRSQTLMSLVNSSSSWLRASGNVLFIQSLWDVADYESIFDSAPTTMTTGEHTVTVPTQTRVAGIENVGETTTAFLKDTPQTVMRLTQMAAVLNSSMASTLLSSAHSYLVVPCIRHTYLFDSMARFSPDSLVSSFMPTPSTANAWAFGTPEKNTVQQWLQKWLTPQFNVSEQVTQLKVTPWQSDLSNLWTCDADLLHTRGPEVYAANQLFDVQLTCVFVAIVFFVFVAVHLATHIRNHKMIKKSFAAADATSSTATNKKRHEQEKLIAVVQDCNSEEYEFKPLPDNQRLSMTFFDVHYKRGSETILDGVFGYIMPGEMVGILGKSGSGKTSLFRVLTRDWCPDMKGEHVWTGCVWLGSTAVHNQESSIWRHKIGFVPQFHTELDGCDLTVAEYLFYQNWMRTNKEFSVSKISALLAMFELSGRAGQIVNTLSGGQKKSLAIATELLTEPAVLVLDEPTSGLDTSLALNVMSVLRRLASMGHAVLVSIHQPRQEIVSLFSRIWVLHDKHFIATGASSEVFDFMSKTVDVCTPTVPPGSPSMSTSSASASASDSASTSTNVTVAMSSRTEYGVLSVKAKNDSSSIYAASVTCAASSVCVADSILDLLYKHRDISWTASRDYGKPMTFPNTLFDFARHPVDPPHPHKQSGWKCIRVFVEQYMTKNFFARLFGIFLTELFISLLCVWLYHDIRNPFFLVTCCLFFVIGSGPIIGTDLAMMHQWLYENFRSSSSRFADGNAGALILSMCVLDLFSVTVIMLIPSIIFYFGVFGETAFHDTQLDHGLLMQTLFNTIYYDWTVQAWMVIPTMLIHNEFTLHRTVSIINAWILLVAGVSIPRNLFPRSMRWIFNVFPSFNTLAFFLQLGSKQSRFATTKISPLSLMRNPSISTSQVIAQFDFEDETPLWSWIYQTVQIVGCYVVAYVIYVRQCRQPVIRYDSKMRRHPL